MSEQERIPVGEWIEIQDLIDGFDSWKQIKVKYIGEIFLIGDDVSNNEIVFGAPFNWRRIPDPKKELFNKMISEWKSESLENAYDTKDSLVSIEYMFNWLVDIGYIEVEK